MGMGPLLLRVIWSFRWTSKRFGSSRKLGLPLEGSLKGSLTGSKKGSINGLGFRVSANWSTLRILLFRVLYWGPLFSETPTWVPG